MNAMAPPTQSETIIPSDLGAARQVQGDIEQALAAAGFGEKDVYAVKLALEEALVNAIKHGNQLDPQKTVTVRYTVAEDRFDIHIQDQGAGFDPDDVPDPTAPENLERPCGRGLLLMRHYMSAVEYRESGRAVVMSKVRKAVN